MSNVLTPREIERILAVTDALGISREAVVIPLRREHPGRVRRGAGGKFEIVVDADAHFDQWLSGLEAELRALMEPSPGERAR